MKAKKVWSNVLFTVLVVLTAFFGLVAICGLKFRIKFSVSIVQQYSMVPTINKSLYLSDPYFDFENTQSGDVAYINKFAKIKVGDIVIANVKSEPDPVAKRVVGMPGDKIRITKTRDQDDQIVYTLLVNEKPLYSKPNKQLIGTNSMGEGVYLNNYNSYSNYLSFFNDPIGVGNTVRANNEKVENNPNCYIILGVNQCFLMGDNWQSSRDSLLFGAVDVGDIQGRVDYIVDNFDNKFWAATKLMFKDMFYGAYKSGLDWLR